MAHTSLRQLALAIATQQGEELSQWCLQALQSENDACVRSMVLSAVGKLLMMIRAALVAPASASTS